MNPTLTRENFIVALGGGIKVLKQPEPSDAPAPGTDASWIAFFTPIANINFGEDRGVTAAEQSQFAKQAGMNPQGAAGFFTEGAKYLIRKQEDDSRWVTEK